VKRTGERKKRGKERRPVKTRKTRGLVYSGKFGGGQEGEITGKMLLDRKESKGGKGGRVGLLAKEELPFWGVARRDGGKTAGG